MASPPVVVPPTPVQKQTENKPSTFDADPLLVVAYVIFAFGALLLFAAALRLGYWCIQRRARKKHLDWMLLNNVNDGTKPYCGRGVKSRPKDYSNSDNNSLRLRMDDMFGRQIDVKGDKQDNIYAKVKKKRKESTHATIPTGDSDPNNKPEDFWHIGANEIPENEGSITNLAGSSMRLHRDVPLVRILREDERESASIKSDVVNVVDETEQLHSGDDISENGGSVKEDKENIIASDFEENDSIKQTESARVSLVSEKIAVGTSEEKAEEVHLGMRVSETPNEESDTSEDEQEDLTRPLPGPVNIPGLKITQGKSLMTLEDIRAESINPGSFVSLQASWKMREAQIQSGLNAAMLTPTVGLNYADDDYAPIQTTPSQPVVREQPVLTQKYTNEEEERMFTFESSKGKLASVMESPKINRKAKPGDDSAENTLVKRAKIGSFASGVGVAAVDQIYMDPQEIIEEKRGHPVFSIPPPPPLPADDEESGNEEENNDNRFSYGADDESINSNSQTVRTSMSDIGNSSVVSDNLHSNESNDNVPKQKQLRFNEEIEEIRRISVMDDDVSEVSSVANSSHINRAFSGLDDEEQDDDSMIVNDKDDDEDSEYDDQDDSEEEEGSVLDSNISSVQDRPPTPVPERKTTHM